VREKRKNPEPTMFWTGYVSEPAEEEEEADIS